VLLVLGGIGAALYFFVFAEDGLHLEFEPMPDKDSLIYFKQSNSSSSETQAKKIDNFLEDYIKPPKGDKTPCNEHYIKPETQRDIPCAIDVSTLNECSPTTRYGYGRGTPCVIVKLNKIVGWEPESYYASDEEEAMKRGMPDNLIKHIKQLNNSNIDVNRRRLNTTWITCEGEASTDRENIGDLTYHYPGFNSVTPTFGGIPNMNFPFLEQEAYLSPFIFVKFTRPTPNIVIRVKCQAWAKNIPEGEGTVEFELLMD